MVLLSIFFMFTAWTVETVYRDSVVSAPPLAIDSLGNPYVIVSKRRASNPISLFYLFLYYKVNDNWYVDTF